MVRLPINKSQGIYDEITHEPLPDFGHTEHDVFGLSSFFVEITKIQDVQVNRTNSKDKKARAKERMGSN